MPEPTTNRKAACTRQEVARRFPAAKMRWVAALALLACLLLPACGLPPAGGAQPEWLTKLIQKLESEPVANPPAAIYRYEYGGRVVYFLPQHCCDIASTLYDEAGNVICHPDGGITGKGDGRCPDFSSQRQNETLIWKDKRTGR